MISSAVIMVKIIISTLNGIVAIASCYRPLGRFVDVGLIGNLAVVIVKIVPISISEDIFLSTLNGGDTTHIVAHHLERGTHDTEFLGCLHIVVSILGGCEIVVGSVHGGCGGCHLCAALIDVGILCVGDVVLIERPHAATVVGKLPWVE